MRDIIGTGGGGLIVYGAWLVYQPAGFIVAGAMLVTVAALYARNEPRAEPKAGP
jgi:hypothetical protein